MYFRAGRTGLADQAAAGPIISARHRDGETCPLEAAAAGPMISANYNIVNQVLYYVFHLCRLPPKPDQQDSTVVYVLDGARKWVC